MTTIYLIRHCHYQNTEKVIPFRLPGFPLSEEGKTNAQKLAKEFKIKNISAIYTSPILRAHQTADIIGAFLNLTPIPSDLAIETSSPLQGIKKTDFDKTGGLLWNRPQHFKGGGETKNQVLNRTQKLITQILKKHKDQNIIIVTHGDPIMTYAHTLNPSLSYIPMGSYFTLTFSSPTASPVLTNTL